MRYHKLTEKQLHEMHREFSVFLSSQGIDKEKWNNIKKNKPRDIGNYINLFSDIVWEKILTDCEFVDFLTPDQVFLFETNKKLAHLIVVKLKSKTLDLTTSKGFEIMLKKIRFTSLILYLLTATEMYYFNKKMISESNVLASMGRFSLDIQTSTVIHRIDCYSNTS